MRRGAHAHDPISRIKSAKQIYTWINRAKIIVHPLYSCFMSPDIAAHKFGIFASFVMNIELVLWGLDCTLCFCSSRQMMICGCLKNCQFYFPSTSLAQISHAIGYILFITTKLLSLSLSLFLSLSIKCRQPPFMTYQFIIELNLFYMKYTSWSQPLQRGNVNIF